MRSKITLLAVIALVAVVLLGVAAPGVAESDESVLGANTDFFVPKPNHRAVEQVADLMSSGEKRRWQ